MKFGVIIFPGSNCDHDAFWTAEQVAKQQATFLWHDSHDLENCDVVIVPGRLRLRRLSAHRGNRQVLAGDGIGPQVRRWGRVGARHL